MCTGVEVMHIYLLPCMFKDRINVLKWGRGVERKQDMHCFLINKCDPCDTDLKLEESMQTIGTYLLLMTSYRFGENGRVKL